MKELLITIFSNLGFSWNLGFGLECEHGHIRAENLGFTEYLCFVKKKNWLNMKFPRYQIEKLSETSSLNQKLWVEQI